MPNALQAFVFRALLLLGLPSLPGCFDPITLPTCEHPADCPAGYVACDTGHCLLGSARCDAAAAVADDGCCFVGAGERAGDSDCLGFSLDLEGVGFSGPAVDGFDGAALVTTLAPAPAPQTGSWVWLTRVARDGRVAWRAPVGEGTSAHLAPPVATIDGAWAAFDAGLRRFDRSGAERDVIADAPLPGHLAVDSDGRLAWWSPARGALVVRGGAPGSPEHVVALAASDAEVVGPVFATGSAHVIVAAGTRLRRHAASDGAPTGEADLAEAARDLAVSAGRLYVLEGARGVSAFVLAEGALARAWAAPVALPADALGQVLQDEEGRLVLPAAGGRLFVLVDRGAEAAVTSHEAGGPGGPGLLLLADGWLVQAAGSRLRAARLLPDAEGGALSARWEHDLGNEIAGALLADPEGHVLVLDAVGRLARLVSGAPGAARAGWPTTAGSATQGGVEVGGGSPTTEEP